MTPQQLVACTGARIDRAQTFAPLLDAAMAEFDISTPARQAAFLAQIGHESGGLHWLVEIWGPTDAQSRYEGRADLGNVVAGDGYKFRGRGLVQITGRMNYTSCGLGLGVDLLDAPEQLGIPDLASRSAAWFWDWNGLNELADNGDFLTITRRINGGTNGLADREALYAAAQSTLGAMA